MRTVLRLGLISLFVLVTVSKASAQISIDNDLTGDGAVSIQVAPAGDSTTGIIDPNGSPQSQDVIFEYYHYIDVGNSGSAVRLANTNITLPPTLTADDQVTSEGNFAGENGQISWSSVASINSGSDSYIVRFTFQSRSPFGRARFIQYLDEDVGGVSDDVLVVAGTPGQQNFQLLTADGSIGVGIAQGIIQTGISNATFRGFAADRYSDLRSRITGGGTAFSIQGEINTQALPPINDPRYPGLPVYGPRDITTAIAFDLDPNATTAVITVYIGGSADGRPTAPPDVEPLRTPVHSKYNTFLGQYNFLELANAGSQALDVGVLLYNLLGNEVIRTTVTVNPRDQIDVDVNTMLTQGCVANPGACAAFSDLDGNGVIDTYGLVRLDFEDGNPNKVLIGRMSHYRLNINAPGYSFAFARELRNPSRGVTFGTANTFDPQGLGYLVPNWVEVINLDSNRSHNFTYNLYNQEGQRVYQGDFNLPPLGEFDVQGGHEITNSQGQVVQGTYLVEVVPSEGDSEYVMYVARYSSNSYSGAAAQTYNFGFAVDGRTGNPGSTFVPITREDTSGLLAAPTNWVEVVNTASEELSITTSFRDSNGVQVGSDTRTFAPHSQFHYQASAILPASSLGVAEVSANRPEKVLVQSLVYLHDLQFNQVQTAYATQGRSIPFTRIHGSANTNIQMASVLRLISVGTQTAGTTVSVTPAGGSTSTANLTVPAGGAAQLFIDSTPPLNFPANSYGLVSVDSTVQGGVAGQILRVRHEVIAGALRFDFVMPTLLR